MAAATGKEAAAKFDPHHSPNVPPQWVVVMRLALVAFMTTAWFLSRSYTTTMYLVLGLATSTIALQGSAVKLRGRVHWIFSALSTEILLIIIIYFLVRLRH
jgi:hypothetical protein